MQYNSAVTVDEKVTTQYASIIEIGDDVVKKNTVEFVYEKKPVYDAIKRFFDIVLSILALVVLSPVFLVVMIVIFIDDPGNPFFTQDRNGKDNKVFKMLKFRSMYKDAEQRRNDFIDQNEADGPLFKIKKDPRITKCGGFIRKTSIDELPQLLNILKGDMSIIGPRPLATYEQDQFTDYQKQRLAVKPGLSCIWQIEKIDNSDFDFLIEKDFEYIADRSLWFDTKLIFRTFGVVFKSKNC